MPRLVLSHLVRSAALLNGLPPDPMHVGAVDSTVVTNISLIEWNEVVPFEPVGIESNVSSYLEWVIPISVITVSTWRVLRPSLLNASVRR
jgi:hypothetical protein